MEESTGQMQASDKSEVVTVLKCCKLRHYVDLEALEKENGSGNLVQRSF